MITSRAFALAAAVAGVLAGLAALGFLMAPVQTATTDDPIAVARLEPPRPPVAPAAVVTREPVQPHPRPYGELEPAEDDTLIRSLVAEASSHPALTEWLVTDDLLHRFVRAAYAVAGGLSPRDELDFMRPDGLFLVTERDGRMVVAPSTYHRYDLPVEVLASLDPAGTAGLYRRLKPRLDATLADVAWYRDDFDALLLEAIDHLLEVRPPEDAVEVERRVLTYAYADDRLEGLTDAQRHLLRMGRRNVVAVQSSLRTLRGALFPDAAPVRVPGAADDGPSHQGLRAAVATELVATTP
jgi:hypothetical protein